MWGEVKYAAKASSPATTKPAAAAAAEPAAAAAAPPRPRTSAPAPLTAVPGSSSVTKTPQQISEDSGDDADDYIAVRDPKLLKRR
jgi:outer membrane receptor protein involved in Fe transport